jgi:hypothetical protein
LGLLEIGSDGVSVLDKLFHEKLRGSAGGRVDRGTWGMSLAATSDRTSLLMPSMTGVSPVILFNA